MINETSIDSTVCAPGLKLQFCVILSEQATLVEIVAECR